MKKNALSTALVAAWRITRSIAGKSSSNVVEGSFVNHFGGSPSAAMPKGASSSSVRSSHRR